MFRLKSVREFLPKNQCARCLKTIPRMSSRLHR